MELYLIRHAQSHNNALPESKRQCDPPLTELGRQQAALLSGWIEPPPHSVDHEPLSAGPRDDLAGGRDHGTHAGSPGPAARAGGMLQRIRGGALVGEPGMTRSEIEREFPGYTIEPQLDGQGWWQRRDYE